LLLPPATSDTGDVASDRYPPLVEGPARPLPKNWWNLSGYLASVNWRPQPDNPSGAVFWLTVGAHLVDGEETTSLEKLAWPSTPPTASAPCWISRNSCS
jgi:hypothetical protein